MFWRNRQKTRNTRNVNRRGRLNARLLGVEMLESREMLSGAGLVNVVIAPVGPAGTLALVGDADNNSVKITSGTNTGDYVITGVDNTLLEINGAGVTMQQVTVNGIVGIMQVHLGLGTNQFDFEAGASGRSVVPADLLIVNSTGDNTNIIHDTTINGNLSVSKAAGASGFCNLQLARTTVVGNATVDNQTGGGSGGSNTLIDTCQLQGGGGLALTITNAYGYDTLSVTNSELGSGVFPAAIVVISNGDGASAATFTAPSGSQTRIDGGLVINNGNNVPDTFDSVNFINTEVIGAVSLNDAGGNTQTIVTNSHLGTGLTVPAPVMIANNVGQDQFTMSASDAQWGLSINNDVVAAGASNWGSTTTISANCKIGTCPLGQAPALAPNGLTIMGDEGADLVTISGTSTGTQIGGNAALNLFDGNNKINFTTTTMAGLNVVTGAGNDDLSIVGCTIPVSLTVNLGNGADRMKVKQTSVLPNPLYGLIAIDGGSGVDQFFADSYPGVTPALGLQPGFEIWGDWT